MWSGLLLTLSPSHTSLLQALCHKFLDRAVLRSGINFVDTAEQYPIPSDRACARARGAARVLQEPAPSCIAEGDTERIIGSWLKKDAGRRQTCADT